MELNKDQVYKLSTRQINKLKKQFPVLFTEVEHGSIKPISLEYKDIYIVIPDTPNNLVEIRATQKDGTFFWLGDISFKDAWRL